MVLDLSEFLPQLSELGLFFLGRLVMHEAATVANSLGLNNLSLLNFKGRNIFPELVILLLLLSLLLLPKFWNHLDLVKLVIGEVRLSEHFRPLAELGGVFEQNHDDLLLLVRNGNEGLICLLHFALSDCACAKVDHLLGCHVG